MKENLGSWLITKKDKIFWSNWFFFPFFFPFWNSINLLYDLSFITFFKNPILWFDILLPQSIFSISRIFHVKFISDKEWGRANYYIELNIKNCTFPNWLPCRKTNTQNYKCNLGALLWRFDAVISGINASSVAWHDASSFEMI